VLIISHMQFSLPKRAKNRAKGFTCKLSMELDASGEPPCGFNLDSFSINNFAISRIVDGDASSTDVYPWTVSILDGK